MVPDEDAVPAAGLGAGGEAGGRGRVAERVEDGQEQAAAHHDNGTGRRERGRLPSTPMADIRSLPVTPELIDYAVGHGSWPVDDVLADLRAETLALGSPAGMQIGADQGQLLTMLARIIGANRAVEVGTFTGYSSLCIARGLAEGGSLLCCDVDEEWTALARRAWARAGLEDRIELRLAPAIETLRSLPATEHVDLAFVDADGVALTRELVSEPANVIYPESFVARCEELQDMGVEFTVLGQEEMEKLGMGALLGVSQGSARPPRMLAMRWDGTNGAQKKPLALVGKGVTFDTGGISLKPPAGMEDMKWDMGGAGAVAGTMKALAGRKAKAHVIGVCGLVENMPDGKAQRPGDVVTSMSGQTIEVINTDAEGRLVLCDALHWTQETFEPEVVVNLATLTGAIIISLGHEHAGCFSNDDDLSDKLLAAGKTAGDPLWRFPLTAAYDKQINSPIADMKNVGGKGAGSITAAQFLKRFIKDGVKWAHLDIAGMVWADKPGPVWDKGATGFGVRLLDQYVADNFEK